TGVDYGYDAARVAVAVGWRVLLDLVLERAAPRALAAGTVARRVAALDHEALHDAMESQPVVVAVLGEQAEVLDRFRRVGGEELDLDRPLVGLDHAVHAAGALRSRRALVGT